MSANFTPSLNSYTDLTPFRFWCQKILPLVYDDSLSYYELLCKVVDYLNKTMEDVNLSIEDVEKLHTAYESLQGYVNDYFNNLDVQEEINNKLDALVEDGTIHDIFNSDVEAILNTASQAAHDAIEAIPSNVTAWLDTHVTPETTVVIDESLTISGAAADAKKTGDEISALKSDLKYDDYNNQKTFNGKYRILTTNDWEQGTLNSNGLVPSTTRSRTKGFFPVFAGDVITILPFYADGVPSASFSVNIWYYDNNKEYVSTSQWYTAVSTYVSVTIQNDGYVKIHGSTGDYEKFGNSHIRISHAEEDTFYYEQMYGSMVLPTDGKLDITGEILEFGGLGVNGEDVATAKEYYALKTFNYIKMNAGDIVNTNGDDTYEYVVYLYDSNFNHIEHIGYRNAPYTVENDCYVRLICRRKDTAAFNNKNELDGYLWLNRGGNTLPIVNSDFLRVEKSAIADLAYGAITNSGIDPRQDRFYVKKYFAVKKGDILHVLTTGGVGLHYTLNFYNANGARTSWSEWKTDPYYIIEHDGFIRVHFYKDGGDIVLSDYNSVVSVIYMLNDRILKRVYNHPEILLKKPEVLKTNIHIGQDGCMIGGRLWAFDDGESATGDIRVIDLATWETVETKTQNLGHANCVDYNEHNDYLLTYVRGTSGYGYPAIGLYPHPGEKDSLLKTDPGYIIINLYGETGMLSPSASLCWGEDDQTIYFMDGYYSSMSPLTPASSISIYKIQLGLGTNDLSNGGYGNYTAAEAGQYNGTCKIIKTYTGEVANGLDTVMGASYIGTPQGMKYDGYLYVGFGTAGHNFLVIELDDAGTYRVIKNYMYHMYTDDRTEKLYEPELLVLDKTKIICGSANATNGYLLTVFER